MDRYRSPQFSFASLQISSPRSLRPRENRHTEQSVNRYEPEATHPPVIPIALSQGRPVVQNPHDDRPYTSEDLETNSPPPSDMGSSTGGTSPGRRLLDGFVDGLRRIPRAMAKQNSRESLYQEYLAESEAASQATSPPYRYTSTVLSDIPETSTESDTPQRYISETRPVGMPFVNNAGIMSRGAVSSPTYTNSRSTSQYSKEESIGIPLPPKGSWAYYIRHVQLFIRHVYNLPWSSSRIVNDYVPAKHGRGGYGEQKPIVSWYSPRGATRHNEKAPSAAPVVPEFFLVPVTPMSAADLVPPLFAAGGGASVFSDGAATAVRPTQSPMTTPSAGYGLPSPGISSHGQGRHAASYSWYYSSPAPMRSFAGQYFSATSTPYTRTGSLGLSP